MPRPDGDFAAWANHYYDAVEKWYSVQGFDPSELKALKEALSAWNASFPAHVRAHAAAEGARQAKDAARAALEKEVRPVTNFVQGYPKTTNADRADMGITVRDTSPSPVPAPTTAPLARIESGNRLTHTLRFTDESTPTRRGKPRGVQGAEVWLAIGDANTPAPPLGESYKLLSLSSRGNLNAAFTAADAGKTAYYALRWVSTRGEKGSWSAVAGLDTSSAGPTVAA